MGSNESQYKILNPHVPQGRVYERILTKNGAKNEGKSRIFEYLATPNNQYLDLTKNFLFFFADNLRIRTIKMNANYVIESPTQLNYGPRSEDAQFSRSQAIAAIFSPLSGRT